MASLDRAYNWLLQKARLATNKELVNRSLPRGDNCSEARDRTQTLSAPAGRQCAGQDYTAAPAPPG